MGEEGDVCGLCRQANKMICMDSISTQSIGNAYMPSMTGYLMFEDLKAQWKTLLDPDYVLIDSRTGHTDVGGICTRQLPDAVTICFSPMSKTSSG